jgi:hypothetical protein
MEVIMNRVKFTLIAASLALATTLTLSCSDDDGGTPACTYPIPSSYFGGLDGHAACGEDSEVVKSECEDPELSMFGEAGSYSEGCPSGSTKQCNMQAFDGMKVYFYGQTFGSMTCEDIEAAMQGFLH